MYKIEHQIVTGIKGACYKMGEIVDESVFLAESIEKLLEIKAISLIKKEKKKDGEDS